VTYRVCSSIKVFGVKNRFYRAELQVRDIGNERV
jgi:hypothetical protein